MQPYIAFKRLRDDAIIPVRATLSSAGFDLCAAEDTVVIGCGGVVAVPTGIAVAMPKGTYGRIAMRSGLAINHSLCVTAGVIDCDYRGEIKVLVYRPCNGPFLIKKGTRFAQLVPELVSYADAMVLDELPAADLHLGFGSTGDV